MAKRTRSSSSDKMLMKERAHERNVNLDLDILVREDEGCGGWRVVFYADFSRWLMSRQAPNMLSFFLVPENAGFWFPASLSEFKRCRPQIRTYFTRTLSCARAWGALCGLSHPFLVYHKHINSMQQFSIRRRRHETRSPDATQVVVFFFSISFVFRLARSSGRSCVARPTTPKGRTDKTDRQTPSCSCSCSYIYIFFFCQTHFLLEKLLTADLCMGATSLRTCSSVPPALLARKNARTDMYAVSSLEVYCVVVATTNHGRSVSGDRMILCSGGF